MKKIIKVGAVDQTLDLFALDSSVATGAGLTGLVFNTASLVCYYRKGATGAATALTLATQTVGGAHSDGGFVEISSANMPGMYRLDLSDTIVAAAGSVSIMLKGATNMAPVTIELQVVAIDVENATTLGVTNLDAAVTTRLAPTTAGRTLDVSAGGEAGLDWANIGSPTTAQNLSATNIDVDQVVASVSGAVGSVSGAVGSVTGGVTVTTNNDKTGYAIGVAGIAATAFDANAITDAAVANDVVDAIWAKAIAELSQAAPSATPTVLNALALLHMIARNQVTVTSSSKQFTNDAGTVVFKKALTDNGTTYAEAEMVSGP